LYESTYIKKDTVKSETGDKVNFYERTSRPPIVRSIDDGDLVFFQTYLLEKGQYHFDSSLIIMNLYLQRIFLQQFKEHVNKGLHT